MTYEHPFNDIPKLPKTSEAGVKASDQADLIPKGTYQGTITDHSIELVTANTPAKGMAKVRTTWQIDLGGRRRLHFMDLVPSETPVVWEKGGEFRDYTLANQLAKALGMVGKDYDEVIREATVTAVNLHIDIDQKTNRNITRKITA